MRAVRAYDTTLLPHITEFVTLPTKILFFVTFTQIILSRLEHTQEDIFYSKKICNTKTWFTKLGKFT